MINKRELRIRLKKINAIKMWQLIAIFILSLILSATFLRLNNIDMVNIRQSVIDADKAGDVLDIENRLSELQLYVSNHMNTSTGRIALQELYYRDANEIKKSIGQGSGTTAQEGAIKVCDPIAAQNGWRWPDPRYISCIDQELSKYTSEDSSLNVKLPNQNLYYHEFIAPIWSNDLAGWSVLISIIIFVIILIRVIGVMLIKILIKRRQRLF